MTELWRPEGDGFIRRLYTQLQADRAAGRLKFSAAPIEEKNRLLLEYVECAAGHDMKPFWVRWAMLPAH